MRIEVSFDVSQAIDNARLYKSRTLTFRLPDHVLSEILADLDIMFGVKASVRVFIPSVGSSLCARFTWNRFMSVTRHHEVNLVRLAIETRMKAAEERHHQDEALKPFLRVLNR